MTATASNALAALAIERPAQFGMLHAFSQQPADYLHPSRRAHFAPGVGDTVWQEARARPCLSELILRALGLHDRPWFELHRPECPLALLDAAQLLRLACHVGAALRGPQVRRSLSRIEVLRWKERLTPPVHAFVMTTAALLPQAEAPPPADDETPVETLGFAWIAAAMAAAPDPLRLRAELKLPAGLRNVPADGAGAARFVRSIHSALEPQWCSSFAMPRN